MLNNMFLNNIRLSISCFLTTQNLIYHKCHMDIAKQQKKSEQQYHSVSASATYNILLLSGPNIIILKEDYFLRETVYITFPSLFIIWRLSSFLSAEINENPVSLLQNFVPSTGFTLRLSEPEVFTT